MKVRFQLEENCGEPEVILRAREETEELRSLKAAIRDAAEDALLGFRDGQARRLFCRDVVRVYAERDRVLAECGGETYSLREKLYELEEKLARDRFVRISRFELVNLRKIEKLDLSVTGTIRLHLRGGAETYVSRRNVARIKSILGL